MCACVWSKKPQECGLLKFEAIISFLIQLLGMEIEMVNIEKMLTIANIVGDNTDS